MAEKKLGFGCMRLPELENGEIDIETFKRMVDGFMEAGFTYFDTAHGYHSGKSEEAVKAALTDRYPRESYTLTDKLSSPFFETEEEIEPLFMEQLRLCGVGYFDWYLFHAMNKERHEKYKRTNAYKKVEELRDRGYIRHIGISFHDTAEVLDEILSEVTCIEYVQLQFNYMDYDSPAVQSGKCADVARKYGKKILVMEPVKGGTLANLPEDAAAPLRSLGGGSDASYAIRFAASEPDVFMVLSGMSNEAQAMDNIAFMKDFRPLDEVEREAIAKVVSIMSGKNLVGCTACHYCTDTCPMRIPIPEIIGCLNENAKFGGDDGSYYYDMITAKTGKASDCVSCGTCESLCPQKVEIREALKKAASEFEKKEST